MATKRLTPKQLGAQVRRETLKAMKTHDSFNNFMARVGLGTNNQSRGSTYTLDYFTRMRVELEAAYRSSWLVGAAVDMPAEDMTRAGVEFETTLKPEQLDIFSAACLDLQIWDRIFDTIKWARLFGGAIGVLLIDGQKPNTPLRTETVSKGQFKGILVLDRWQVEASTNDLITELGPDMGLPKFYKVLADAQAMPAMNIHHSRVFRMEGVSLPYYQRLAENMWGESIIERIHDRLVAFDSASVGAGQLIYKAHLRTYKVEELRNVIAAGGQALEGLVKQIQMMRLYQSNEGITLMDAKDEFEAHSYTFSGLSDMLMQFGQQISGALQIPLVRLFGQSPAGLNSTGESDLRTYYDHIKKQQERSLRRPLNKIFDVLSRSVFGTELPPGFKYQFSSLWLATEKEKSEIGLNNTTSVLNGYTQGLVSAQVALRELRQQSHVSNVWSNITDEDIEAADDQPPKPELGADPDEEGKDKGKEPGDA